MAYFSIVDKICNMFKYGFGTGTVDGRKVRKSFFKLLMHLAKARDHSWTTVSQAGSKNTIQQLTIKALLSQLNYN